jgi:hypothetical protein
MYLQPPVSLHQYTSEGTAALLSVASRRLRAASVRCPVIVPLLTGNPEITAAHVLPVPSKFRKVSVCGVLPVPGVLILDPCGAC